MTPSAALLCQVSDSLISFSARVNIQKQEQQQVWTFISSGHAAILVTGWESVNWHPLLNFYTASSVNTVERRFLEKSFCTEYGNLIILLSDTFVLNPKLINSCQNFFNCCLCFINSDVVAESFIIFYSSIGKVTPAWEMGNFFTLLLYALEENKENRDWFGTAKEKK